jgi:hypothetical protein
VLTIKRDVAEVVHHLVGREIFRVVAVHDVGHPVLDVRHRPQADAGDHRQQKQDQEKARAQACPYFEIGE